jgi:hypothetical protein
MFQELLSGEDAQTFLDIYVLQRIEVCGCSGLFFKHVIYICVIQYYLLVWYVSLHQLCT